jgi:fructose-1,6-bisphosphatase/inositol monophosphatase family enzyme
MDLLSELGWKVSREIHEEVRSTPVEVLAAVNRESEDDTIFAIDVKMEERILSFFEKRVRPNLSVALIMEGAPGESLVFGGSGRKSDVDFTILMDPIDGTRGLMYGKRSAWLLTGAAPGGADNLRLSDITVALQTEIPTAKQQIADQLRAFRGNGALGTRCDFTTGAESDFPLAPSRSKNIHYGFVTFNRFFPVAKDLILTVEMELTRRLAAQGENTFYFEDQYICNGGQLAELMMGHDRIVCDLRAVVSRALELRGAAPMLSTHPYDICTELIAREAGCCVTDEKGAPLNAPFDTTTSVTWLGYANDHLRRLIEPHMTDILGDVGKFIP